MAESENTAPVEQTEQTQQPEKPGTQTSGKEQKKETAPAEKTFTQAEVDEIVNKRLTRERKDQEEKQAEAAKLAAMNEKERTDYQIKQLTEKLAEYEARENRAAMAKEATTMLRSKGLDGIPDELIGYLVRDNAEQTKNAVDGVASAFAQAVDDAVKAKLRGATPETGRRASTLTKEQILAVKDRKERQRLIEANMDLFKK